MGITSSLITGLSGLAANQAQIDVVGNNIANVNTVGFKSSHLDFKTQFFQNFSFGRAPNGTSGGTNPVQVGMGIPQGAITRDFADGSLEVTGVDSNLAIRATASSSSRTAPTRPTPAMVPSSSTASTNWSMPTACQVQGYGVDSNFNVVPGVLQNVTIPLGHPHRRPGHPQGTSHRQPQRQRRPPLPVSDLTLDQDFYISDGAGGVTGTAAHVRHAPHPHDRCLRRQSYFQAGDTLTLSGTVGIRQPSPRQNPHRSPADHHPRAISDLHHRRPGHRHHRRRQRHHRHHRRGFHRRRSGRPPASPCTHRRRKPRHRQRHHPRTQLPLHHQRCRHRPPLHLGQECRLRRRIHRHLHPRL